MILLFCRQEKLRGTYLPYHYITVQLLDIFFTAAVVHFSNRHRGGSNMPSKLSLKKICSVAKSKAFLFGSGFSTLHYCWSASSPAKEKKRGPDLIWPDPWHFVADPDPLIWMRNNVEPADQAGLDNRQVWNVCCRVCVCVCIHDDTTRTAGIFFSPLVLPNHSLCV